MNAFMHVYMAVSLHFYNSSFLFTQVQQLVTGFGNFTQSSSASGALLSTLDIAEYGSSISTVVMLDKVSDQVLDIVLTEEEAPLQQILIEQLVKIMTANARMIWTEARLRSGVLASGRTLLGTLVDPLVSGNYRGPGDYHQLMLLFF
jgi:hypothetical protein